MFKKNIKILCFGKNKNKGFVLLFAVVLSSVILSISLGLSEITLSELNFSTSARNTNSAFFAADVGVECALFYENAKVGTTEGADLVTPFGYDGSSGDLLSLSCANQTFQLNEGVFSLNGPWTFYLVGLGIDNKACVITTVDKTSIPGVTRVISKGYNEGGQTTNCSGEYPNRVEREIETRYNTP